jgi:hypothetical protein
LIFTEFAGMPFRMKKNEASNPIYIRLLRSPAVAACAHKSAHLIKEFGLAPGGSICWNRAHLKLPPISSELRLFNGNQLVNAMPELDEK